MTYYISIFPDYLSLDSIVFKDNYHIDITASEQNIIKAVLIY